MMSDCPILHTGQAVVTRRIAMGLHNSGKYNVVVAAWGYNGYPHPFPFMMLPCSARDFGRGGNGEAGIPGINNIIDMVKPQVLWTIGDIWMVNYLADEGAVPNRKKTKWVAYTPVDGTPIPEYWAPWLKAPDRLVCETNWGFDQVKNLIPDLDHRWVYHGTDEKKYYPLPDETKKKIRKGISYLAITGENNLDVRQGIGEDDFIVGTIARNQPRKNYDRNLKGFAMFAKDKPNAKLWIHANPIDQGYNLVQLANFLGIQDKVIFTPKNSIVNGLNEEEMNMMMNVFDVHLLPTQGEGFGIPILETMSAGVPQVVTDYTSHVEFAKTAGEMIPVVEYDDFITGLPHPVERAMPRPSNIKKCLDRIYNDKDYRLQCSKNARSVAEKMGWDATIPQWIKIFDDVIAAKPKSEQAPPLQKLATIKV